jgi:NAD(P)-dependent dehydrogenase (short-subunit alcohol dehydrogenase family)
MTISGRLSGRVAVVTGGADGIGLGIVRRLAADGARVLLADIQPERGREAAAAAERDADVAVAFHETDVTDRASVERMIAAAIERFGAVDILVNNAWAGSTIKRVEHKTDAEMQHGITMAMSAALWSMQAAFPGMKAKAWGRIINIASLNGVNAHIGSAEYNVGKEALRALSRTVAREWAGHGITCNIICPASVSAAYRQFRDANPETAAIMAAQNPMGRMGDPEADIAPVVAFLASEDSRYLTGNTLFVDGGAHINGVSWAPELPDGP